jgi:hypothetical protein
MGGSRVAVCRSGDAAWPHDGFVDPSSGRRSSTAVVVVILLVRGQIGSTAALYLAVSAELLLVLFVVVDMVAMLPRLAWRGSRSLARGRPDADVLAAEELPFERWTMVLCHQEDPCGGLLDDAARRLDRLSDQDSTLVCPRRAVTTGAMRAEVRRWADGLPDLSEDPEVSVRFRGKWESVPRHAMDTGALRCVGWHSGCRSPTR